MEKPKNDDGALFAVPPQALIKWIEHNGEGMALALALAMAVKMNNEKIAKALPDSSPHLNDLEMGNTILEIVCHLIGTEGSTLETFAKSVHETFTKEGAKLEPLNLTDPQEIVENSGKELPHLRAQKWLKKKHALKAGVITPRTPEAKADAARLLSPDTEEAPKPKPKPKPKADKPKPDDLPPFPRNGGGGDWNPDGSRN
jgi:hypothetical protein